MRLLAELTLRGTLMFLAVAVLDRLFASRSSARARRAWWLLVPMAFLLTVPLPGLPPAARPATVATPELGVWSALASLERVNRAVSASVANLRSAVPAGASHPHWPGLVWTVGALCYLLVIVVRTRAAGRHWSRDRLCTDAALLEILEDCKRQAGITAPIGLVVTEAVGTPVILGWLRPRILLPAGLVALLTPEQLRGVLCHELAHFRALDVPLNWLWTLVCAVHWFNPAAHFAFRDWARFCEESGD